MWSPKNDSAPLQNNVLKFLLLEVICVVLMVLDHSAKIATPIRVGISTLTYPLIKLVELPQDGYNFIAKAISNQNNLIDQNAELKQQLSQAQIDLLQLEIIQQQNKELRMLLHAKELLPLKTSATFVTNINTGNNDHIVVIDQGYNQGVTVGQTVLDLNGVAGQVVKVELETSHVLLISDKNHAIPVEILRTGYRTIAYGTGDLYNLSLPEMQQDSDIVVGDILISSGYGDVYPRGLKLASISEILETQDRSFLQAQAELTADLTQLKHILLVWSNKVVELKQ
jgi:rod shape-determining protein MreC